MVDLAIRGDDMEKLSRLSNEGLEILATDFRNNGRVDEAVRTYKQLIARLEQRGDMAGAARMQHMIGVSYKVGNYTEKSLEALEDALYRYKKLEDAVDVGRVLRDIGITYQYAGDVDAALPFLRESIEVLKGTDDAAERGISEVKLGHLFQEMKDEKRAEKWLEKGLATLEPTNQWFYKATAWLHKAEFLASKKEYTEALKSIEAAERIFEEHDGPTVHRRRMAQLYFLKASVYESLRDSELARVARQKADMFIQTLDDASRAYLESKLGYN